ncbi:creatininase family protein [Aminobacterium mobile]|jgi:creatinine amidohydrolase|uniref:creatininase family protein n=1 Tax=Aminobacterium mobile TaxID=81467 RepID=UPI000464B374|nr:creatininase family protein [Aminobacterium mobile]
MYLASLTWKKLEESISEETIGLIPLGSVEQHGPLGPLGTDYMIPEELAKRIEAAYPDRVLLVPTMPYGVCPYHTSFPGTIDMGLEVLAEVMTRIAMGLMNAGIKKIIFLNGHGGNGPSLDKAALAVYNRGGIAAIVDWWVLAGQLNSTWAGGHGAGQETSVMMAIKPDLVHMKDFFPAEIHHLSDTLQNTHISTVFFGKGSVRVIRNVKDVTSNGAYGGTDVPEKANAPWGKEIIEGVSAYLVNFTEEFLKVSHIYRSDEA